MVGEFASNLFRSTANAQAPTKQYTPTFTFTSMVLNAAKCQRICKFLELISILYLHMINGVVS